MVVNKLLDALSIFFYYAQAQVSALRYFNIFFLVCILSFFQSSFPPLDWGDGVCRDQNQQTCSSRKLYRSKCVSFGYVFQLSSHIIINNSNKENRNELNAQCFLHFVLVLKPRGLNKIQKKIKLKTTNRKHWICDRNSEEMATAVFNFVKLKLIVHCSGVAQFGRKQKSQK